MPLRKLELIEWRQICHFKDIHMNWMLQSVSSAGEVRCSVIGILTIAWLWATHLGLYFMRQTTCIIRAPFSRSEIGLVNGISEDHQSSPRASLLWCLNWSILSVSHERGLHVFHRSWIQVGPSLNMIDNHPQIILLGSCKLPFEDTQFAVISPSGDKVHISAAEIGHWENDRSEPLIPSKIPALESCVK
jgi:hypothetical protein